MSESSFKLGALEVGRDHPCCIVAELSANHGQSLDRALEIVRAAGEAGADAIKLQTYRADTITLNADGEHFTIGEGSPWAGRKLYELYEEAHTPWEWHERLREEAVRCGLEFLSSPFDPTAVDFLDDLGVAAFKIASFELVDIGLIAYAASKGRPLILSTGMASFEEIEEGIKAAAQAPGLMILKCTSAYPSPPEEMNLSMIENYRERFGVEVGLSDHTTGIVAPVVAVTLGASLIEKHLTLKRADGGPDSSFSLEPHEFAEMVQGVRTAEKCRGGIEYSEVKEEEASRGFRRSLFVIKDVKKGEFFTSDNVRSIRPGAGLAPKHLASVLGRKAQEDIGRGTPLCWELVSDD